MSRYLSTKFFYALLTLWGVITVIFILFNVLPGDPARMMLDQNENSEQLAIIKKKYGFDRPLWEQYAFYVNDLSPLSFHSINSEDFTFMTTGKYTAISLFTIGKIRVVLKWPYLRESFQKSGKKVTTIIGETLPNTFILALAAILIALFIGVSMGIVSALFKDSIIDRGIQFFSTLGMSVPSFFSAILFAWIFGFLLRDYTHLNMMGSLYEVDDFGEGIHLKIKNLVLPSIVLGIRPLSVVSQLMRNSLLEVMNQDYIRTARAKGLSEYSIIKSHALRNALNPIVTVISGWFASMLAGAVFVEYVFGWNGLGKEIVNALNAQDLPVIMGSVLVIASLFIVINIFVDVIYLWLDPKLRI